MLLQVGSMLVSLATAAPASKHGLRRSSTKSLLHMRTSIGSSNRRCVAATAPAASTSTPPMASPLRSLSEVEVVGVEKTEPNAGHRTHDVEVTPAAPVSESPASEATPAVAAKQPAALARAMSVAQHLKAAQLETKYSRKTRRLSYRMKDTLRRSLVRLVILFNQLSFILLAAIYFIFVTWYLLYRAEGLDEKCSNPWIGVDGANDTVSL